LPGTVAAGSAVKTAGFPRRRQYKSKGGKIMNNFVAIALAILVTVIIGVTIFSGDTNSVKSSITNMLSNTNDRITEITGID
jgi:hypothetical protein